MDLIAAPLAHGSAPRWLRRQGPPQTAWRILRRVAGARYAAALATDLAQLTRRLNEPGLAWVARLRGRDEDIEYLRVVADVGSYALSWAETSSGWRRAEVVLTLEDAGAALAALIGGEGASGYNVLLLLVDRENAGQVASAVTAGDHEAAFAQARLALAYRVGDGWAAMAAPGGDPPGLAGVPGSAAPVALPNRAKQRAMWAAGAVIALAGFAVVVVVSRGSGVQQSLRQRASIAPITVAPTPTPRRPAPSPRQLAAVAYDPDGDTDVVFGGISTAAGGHVFGDAWTWTGQAWVQDLPDSGFHIINTPVARYGAVMAYAPAAHGVVMFGGFDGPVAGRPLNDTWVWDGRQWHLVDLAGPATTFVAVAMAYDASAGQLVLVTASVDHADQLQTWTWNGVPPLLASPSERAWALHPDAGTPPINLMAADPRGGHVLGVVSTRSGPGIEPTWHWDGTRWQALHPASDVVVEQLTATMTDDPADSTVVLVEEQFNDQVAENRGGTWTWDGVTWTHHLGPVPPIVHAFDVTQPAWTHTHTGVALLGGARVGTSYDVEWTWDGLVWSRADLSP